MSDAYTYAVQPLEGGPIKIGMSNSSVTERLKQLQTGSPVKLRLAAVIKGNSETDIHRRFHEYRLHGEWFKPVPALINYLKAHSDGVHDGQIISPPDDDLLTRGQVAQLIQIKSQTLAVWASQHKGPPYIKVGRSVRYSKGALMDWLNSRTVLAHT